MLTAKEIFEVSCKGINIMTPDVVRYGMLAPRVAYELAKGRGFTGKTVYGVSVRSVNHNGDPTDEHTDRSWLCGDLKTAEHYIEELTDELTR